MLQKLIITLSLSILLATPSYAEQDSKQITVKVDGLVCSFCAFSLKKTFDKLNLISDLELSLDNNEIYLTVESGKSISDQQITDSVKDAGYNVNKIIRNDE